MRSTNAHNSPDSAGASSKIRHPISAVIAITLFIAASLAASLSYAGYYFLLRPSAQLDGIKYQDLAEVVKIAMTVVAGIGGTVALTVAVRKQKLAERQHELSEEEVKRQDRRILNERFQNSIEQLGKTESAAVRIGGAYSLAKLADDWLSERQTCINVLCGYLRFPYLSSGSIDGEREVRQTIIGIIRQRLSRGAEVSWDGNLFDLAGAVLDSLDLSDIYLRESTLRLCGCVIQAATFRMKGFFVMGGEIDARGLRVMDGATLDAQGGYLSNSGRVSLTGSTISSGTVIFEDTHIDGGHLDLDHARIEGSGVLNLSHLLIASVPLVQHHPSPLSLDKAEIFGGTVNLERIRITTGRDQSKVTWSGGREEGGGQFIASFRQLTLTDGRISFNHTEIPYGKFSFANGNYTGGVLDFEYAKLKDCCLDFASAKIDGGVLNFSNCQAGMWSSDGSPRSGFAYEWLESLRKMKEVSDRDMVSRKSPCGVVVFLDAELVSGHINFDGAIVKGALLDFPGMRASGGKITFIDSIFNSSSISLWNAKLSDECEIEIKPQQVLDLTVLYSRGWGGLNGHVVLGEHVKLLEVSDFD
ncbi:MAG: hypothetical protein ABIZ05_03070 [Pseudonocardiaceae bacterium]